MARLGKLRNEVVSARLSGAPLLKDRAYEALKDLIQTGVFPPNAFLSERQLAERLGMSKTPIRSALEHLEAQGLVAVSAQQGIVVKELSVREIIELFDVRSAIEPFVVSRLAQRGISKLQAEQIKANLALQEVAVQDEDPLAAARLDIAFHLLLCEILDNQEIFALMKRSFDKLHRTVVRINRQVPSRLNKSFSDHSEIAAGIFKNDAAVAAHAISEHLLFGKQFLLSS